MIFVVENSDFLHNEEKKIDKGVIVKEGEKCVADRIFIAEVEKVYHKDYQCDYYRGVIIDGENNIVERCKDLQSSFDRAKHDAELKLMKSPLYSKSATSEIKSKYEEYKKHKAEAEKQKSVFIYDPEAWNEWMYMVAQGSMYRFRYANQNNVSSMAMAKHSKTPIGIAFAETHRRKGDSDRIFYMSRVQSIYDLENLPGHKDIWKINSVTNILQKSNKDCEVTICYQVYGNIIHDYRKSEKEKTITIKSTWNCFNELMEWFCKLSG